MNKLMLTLLFVGLVLLGGCVSDTDSSTPVEPPKVSLYNSEDIAASLTRLHSAAIPEITDEIEVLDSKIAKYDEKIEALVQIQGDITEALSYYDSMIKKADSPSSNGYVIYDEEERALWFYQGGAVMTVVGNFPVNEYYEVAEFDFEWQWFREAGRWEIYNERVQVRDKETSHTYNHTMLDTVIDNLAKEKSRLVAEQTDISNAKEKSIQVLNDVLDSKDLWEIEEVSKKVYLIRGYGLGYGEDLAMGNWYYYEETESLEPRDSASSMLKDVLTASLR